MIPDLHSKMPRCFCVLRPCFGALLELSLGLFASVERFVLELGPSDLDFARRNSPRTPWTLFLEAEKG